MGMCFKKKTMIGWRNIWSMKWRVSGQQVDQKKLAHMHARMHTHTCTYAHARTHAHTHTHTHTTILWLSGFCPGQTRWAATRRNIHALTPLVIISHPLSASSTQHDPSHPSHSIHVPDSLFPQSLSKFSLVYLLAWHPSLHTPYISSSNQWLLFATYSHTIAICFALLLRLCHLILVSLWILYLEFYFVVSRHTSI